MLENAEAIEAWNTVLFDKFERYRHIVTTGLGIHGTNALEQHPPKPGGRAIDLGCGFGDTAAVIAKRVGPSGSVVGVDAAPRFIETARAEAKAAGIGNATFEVRDVQNEDLGGPYDYAFSRMGTMFFSAPVAAYRNVRRSMKPGGQLVNVVWRRKLDNEFLHSAELRVEQILPHPEKTDQVTCGPGPFSMADANVTADILKAAGFGRITFERSDADICCGKSLDEAVEFGMSLGPAGELIRLNGEEGVRRKPEVVAALKEVFGPYAKAEGVYAPSSTWIISAIAV